MTGLVPLGEGPKMRDLGALLLVGGPCENGQPIRVRFRRAIPLINVNQCVQFDGALAYRFSAPQQNDIKAALATI